jgi:hypothetical protein
MKHTPMHMHMQQPNSLHIPGDFCAKTDTLVNAFNLSQQLRPGPSTRWIEPADSGMFPARHNKHCVVPTPEAPCHNAVY